MNIYINYLRLGRERQRARETESESDREKERMRERKKDVSEMTFKLINLKMSNKRII